MTDQIRDPRPMTSALTSDLTRRRFLQGTGLVGFSAFLAACGTSGSGTQPPASTGTGASQPATSQAPATPATSSAPQSPSAELNFANWPLYIDTDENDTTKHKTLDDFKAKYGTTVNYQEVINANDEFFGTIRPALEAGADTGWDLDRADRLDGRPAHPPQVGRADRPEATPRRRRREHAGRLQGRQLGTRPTTTTRRGSRA